MIFVTATFTLVNGAMRFQNIKELPKFKKDVDEEIRQRDIQNCDALLTPQIKQEIWSHNETAQRIIQHVMNGAFKGVTYRDLHDFVDKFPIRLSGFQNLEDSIDYTLGKMENKYRLERGKFSVLFTKK